MVKFININNNKNIVIGNDNRRPAKAILEAQWPCPHDEHIFDLILEY